MRDSAYDTWSGSFESRAPTIGEDEVTITRSPLSAASPPECASFGLRINSMFSFDIGSPALVVGDS
jgi:hypothetical protein